jgi:cellulose synthase/poly-beta-1,6-N-acetylglucosamine synthase-like glycosyltransferase
MLPSDPLIDRSSCLAVVPAYDEAATVGGVVSAIQRKAPQLDVVVIDDGSTDSTGACAERAGARVLRLYFSAAMSRLTDQTKVLAQRQAILEERIRTVEGAAAEEDEPAGERTLVP